MYNHGSGSVAYGGAPQAGWYGGTYTGYQGAQGAWQGQQPAGYPTQQYQAPRQHQQQVQQPYQQRYQQPYGQQVYQQLPESQQRHVQHQTSRPARAEAPAAGPQDGARGGMRASTPNNRPSKRARADHDRTAEAQQQIPRQRYDPQQDLLGAGDATSPWLDALSADITRFAQQAQPSRHEEQQRQAALTELQRVVDYSLGQTRRGITAILFGSARAGLALHSSDLDIMITGLCQPDGAGGGYDRAGKQVVASHLRKVERLAYKRMSVRSSKLIAHARIPVLKLELTSGLELDVSINDASGVSAANFLQSWQQDYPVLRPLVLVLKSILKQSNLGDVSTGGLGSWSLANMAIAHLQAEEAAGGLVDHAGHMLCSFLKRYGNDWNLDTDAVAVAQGGVVASASLATAAGPFARPGKLAVKDPLTGREVAGGSHRYADVKEMWRELYLGLKDGGAAAAASTTAPDRSRFALLSLVLNCDAVLQRAGAPRAGGQGGYRGSGGDAGYVGIHGGDSRKRSR